MRTTFKVSFYLRSNYENKEGKSPVMLRVFLNGEMANFGSTKIFVDKSLWNNTTSRLWKSHTNLTHPGKYFRPSKVKIMRPTSPK